MICTGGPNLDHSSPDAGKTPPNCVIGNGVTLCAGTPTAPIPDIEPVPPVVSDTTAQSSDGQGAPMQQTQIVVHDSNNLGNNADPGDGSTSTGSTGNAGNNGSEGKSDASGQCADGSTPSASGCNAGYTDNGCDAPPYCSGDPLLCASLRETHAQRCAAQKRGKAADDRRNQLVTDAQASTDRGAGGDDITPGDAWAGGVVGGSGDGDGDGSGGGDSDGDGMIDLQVTRFWGDQAVCPGIPDVIPGLYGISQDTLCLYAGKLAAMLLAMGYVLGTLAFARTVSS